MVTCDPRHQPGSRRPVVRRSLRYASASRRSSQCPYHLAATDGGPSRSGTNPVLWWQNLASLEHDPETLNRRIAERDRIKRLASAHDDGCDGMLRRYFFEPLGNSAILFPQSEQASCLHRDWRAIAQLVAQERVMLARGFARLIELEDRCMILIVRPRRDKWNMRSTSTSRPKVTSLVIIVRPFDLIQALADIANLLKRPGSGGAGRLGRAHHAALLRFDLTTIPRRFITFSNPLYCGERNLDWGQLRCLRLHTFSKI